MRFRTGGERLTPNHSASETSRGFYGTVGPPNRPVMCHSKRNAVRTVDPSRGWGASAWFATNATREARR